VITLDANNFERLGDRIRTQLSADEVRNMPDAKHP
jgi:hypothetical protein